MTLERIEAHWTGLEHSEYHHRPFIGDLVEQLPARAVRSEVLWRISGHGFLGDT